MGRSKLVRTKVVIVGGGFSGTVLAVQLSRLAPHLSITVIDKNPVPARGLAYRTEHDCHLLNVPAGDMSAFPDEPGHAGRITGYSENAEAAEVTFRHRSTGIPQTLRVARVINCSGPQTDCRKIGSPLLASLAEQGMVRPDALALGLDVDANGALLDSNNSPSRCLYAIGPLRKGRLWETTAVPDLRVQAAELAKHLCNETQRQDAETLHAETPFSKGASFSENAVDPVLA